VVEQSRWTSITKENPGHSAWYIERFRKMAADGDDLGGEARFVDAMVPRQARILDAGCGPGRVGALLARAGHEVVGVDVDPVLIEAAEADHPGPLWLVGDLAELDLPARGVTEGFDAIVCAGNVMTFLAPSTRRDVLANLRDHLGDGGRIAVGFGAGRDYEFDEFLADVEAVGLTAPVLLGSWHLDPFTPESEFIVAVLARANEGA
jgi:SAM-dependent methyltransferase